MLSRVFSFIMAIIVTLFPFLWKPGRSMISNETVANAVISSVENKDAAAMEEVMCKNIKDNYEDLTGEINNMLSLIEGEIDSTSWERGYAVSQSDGNGKTVSHNALSIKVNTTDGAYVLLLAVEIQNTVSPEELGIRRVELIKKAENPDQEATKLYEIAATEGIMKWH